MYACMSVSCVYVHVCVRLYEEARGLCQVSSSVAFAFIYGCSVSHWAQSSETQLV